jgi:hypothetical protein
VYNGVPGFTTFSNPSASQQFVPMTLTIPSTVDPNVADISFSYNASAPIPGSGGTNGRPAPGYLRIWLLNGTVSRNPADVNAGGDYVAANTWYTAAQLGFAPGDNSVTLFVEAIAPSKALGDLQIVANVDATGADGKNGDAADAVRVTAVQVSLASIDFNGPNNVNITIGGSQSIGPRSGAPGAPNPYSE